MIEVNDDSIQEALDSDPFVVVYFWAEWCGPCLTYSEIVDDIAYQYPIPLFVKAQYDESVLFALNHDVYSVPTVIAFAGGQEIGRITGSKKQAELAEWVQTVWTQ